MITIYDLEGPFHPPFEPAVVFRTEVLGVRVATTMFSPYMVTTRAVGRRLGPARETSANVRTGVVKTWTRNVELVGFVRTDTLDPSVEFFTQLDRVAYYCAGKVYAQIPHADAVDPSMPWGDGSASRAELYRATGELFA